jgi:hypothetical protein
MQGLEFRVTSLLRQANQEGGFSTSLVCTDQGLLVAAAGEGGLDDRAALASLLDDVLLRARRDLGFDSVDELAIRDRSLGHLVLRTLPTQSEERMFLVVQVPPNSPWRRTTNRLCSRLVNELGGLAGGEVVDDA